jgi:hypothetical protein
MSKRLPKDYNSLDLAKGGGKTWQGRREISRRKFVGSAAAVAAISSLAGKSVLAAASGERSALASTALRDDPDWKSVMAWFFDNDGLNHIKPY